MMGNSEIKGGDGWRLLPVRGHMKINKVTNRPRGTLVPFGWRLVKDEEFLRRGRDFTRPTCPGGDEHCYCKPLCAWEKVDGISGWEGKEVCSTGWIAIRKMTKKELIAATKAQALAKEDARLAKNAKARHA